MSAAYADVERPQALRLRETKYHVFAHHGERQPRAGALAPCRREVRAWVGYGRLVEFLIWVISARVPFRPGGPFPRHLEEMPLQSRAMNVAHQLHTVCRQAHALKGMPSQVVRFGHSAPP
jgi:hypothetical protein